MAEPMLHGDQLADLGKAYLIAKSKFNRAYRRFWEAEVRPCADETGWKLLEVFRENVDGFYFKLGRDELGITQAAWELFRKELVDEADYTFEDAAGFVRWYERLKGRIDRAIAHLFEFHGDSFGDLVDAYPLAGRELVERALASHSRSDRPRREGYLDEQEVRNAVREKRGPEWYKLICVGENYVIHALEAACYRAYLDRILTGRDNRVVWTEEEQQAVEFAGHYDD